MKSFLGLALALSSAACGGSNNDPAGQPDCQVDSSYDPTIDAASFSATVDNPLYPLVPGTTFTYEAGAETVVVEVMTETKMILGVECAVVHDQASVAGEVIEDTYDWFAQDSTGAVWYFGEDTKSLSGTKVVSTEGSWTGGVDSAKPGIVVPANPTVGTTYRQEYYACHAEDMGEVVSVDASETVPAGSFTGCLETKDTTPLEPDVEEHKYYCPGAGLILSIDATNGEREELVSVTP